MSFLSYAQNFEDVLLWRALGAVKNGFYIDVGANDPVVHSVTKAFYDAGWHGINIEPLPAFHQAFLEQRPHDVSLALAAGAREGRLTLYDVPAVNGWASPDPTVAEAHRAEGFEIAEITVPMRTLASVCEEHVHGEIHFLKVDVEGFEGEVLRGMDFCRWRPWLLVIEATLPNSRVTNHASWEALVTGQRYRFAHFDGLNRYYAAEEHAELLEALSVQPNVFDDFIPYHLDSAWRAAKAAGAAAEEACGRLAQAAELQWKAEQRADNATSGAREALARCADLLARYEDANRRAGQAFEARERILADNNALREQLGHASARLEAQNERLARATARVEAGRAQLARAASRLDAKEEQLVRAASQLEAQGAQLAASADEKRMLAASLSGLSAGDAALQAQLEQAQRHNAHLQQSLARAALEGERALQWGRGLEQRVLALQASTSWRLTGPVRAGGALLQRAGRAPLQAHAMRHAKRLVLRLTANERMRRLLIPLLLRFPGRAAQLSALLDRIRRSDPGPAAAGAPGTPQLPAELQALPASARRVLADLRAMRANAGQVRDT